MKGLETAIRDPEPQLWPTASMPERPLAGLTVLVVEDSRFASEALRLLCLRSGARIRRADSIRSAMRHLGIYRPNVLIVDMGLPDGNGAELIRTFTASEPRAPVVLGISGDPLNEQVAIEAGADGFLLKPIERLAIFQQAILKALPADLRRNSLRLLPDDMVCPDKAALRDDLAHVVEVLASSRDTSTIEYIARFLAGIARSAHDAPLEEAARNLARDHAEGNALAIDLARISGLVHDRLDVVGQV